MAVIRLPNLKKMKYIHKMFYVCLVETQYDIYWISLLTLWMSCIEALNFLLITRRGRIIAILELSAGVLSRNDDEEPRSRYLNPKSNILIHKRLKTPKYYLKQFGTFDVRSALIFISTYQTTQHVFQSQNDNLILSSTRRMVTRWLKQLNVFIQWFGVWKRT